MKSTKTLDHIKKYLALGKISFFVGAGVSKTCGLPSWNELICSMADSIGYKYKKDSNELGNFTSEELLKIPQMYYIENNEEKYKEMVISSFNNKCVANEIHDLILLLNPNHILTTNYDTLIEEAANKHGRNFSVINSNDKVADAETLKYIVKVHGDFESDFVLKEQDYLDYEKNYILIDNLVKTIFSTNLVIFIGYGLNDYNIKLILNWVKNIQKGTFINPVFINTSKEISESEKSYMESRGLLVLNCSDITVDYKARYVDVLKKILTYNSVLDLDTKKKKMNYIYEKINGIVNLNSLRREDFDKIFAGEYKLNNRWYIVNEKRRIDKSEVKLDFFEDFYSKEKSYEEIDRKKYALIKRFIKKCGIKGIDSQKSKGNCTNVNIMNQAYISQYDYMYKYIKSEDSCVNRKYRKAYYLAQTGKFEDSYKLYTDILKQAKKEKQWDIYYFSQINRKNIYSIVCSIEANRESISWLLTYGQNVKIYDDRFLELIKLEMDSPYFNDTFSELSYDFKIKYPFISLYGKRNCYKDKYYSLIKKSYEIDKQISKGELTIGLSKTDELKLDMLEMNRFLYDNMLLNTYFDESKIYTKKAMIVWLKAYYKRLSKDSNEETDCHSTLGIEFTITDIILISKNFNIDDLEYLENIIVLKQIPFNEMKELESYIKRKIDHYKQKFQEFPQNEKFIYWKIISDEIAVLLLIASNYVKDSETCSLVLEFMKCESFGHIKKNEIIDRWVDVSNL